jgi:hypothetical protein
VQDEAADYRLDRYRGGMTIKIYLACRQCRKPLSVVITLSSAARGAIPEHVGPD